MQSTNKKAAFTKKKKSSSTFSQKRRMSKRSFRGGEYNRIFSPAHLKEITRVNKKKGRTVVVLFALEYGFLTKQQLEAARKIIRKKTSKRGRLRIKAYSYMPVTKKPKEVRMGKGKGKIENHGAFIRPGKPVFELIRTGVSSSLAALRSAQFKLPFLSKIKVLRPST